MNLQLNLILYMLVMSSVLLAQNSVSLDNGKTEMYGDNGVRTVTISGNNGTGDHEFGQISLSRTLNGTTPAVKAVLTSDVNDGGYLSLADNNSPQNVRVRLYGSATNDTGDHGQLFLSGDSKSSQFFSGFFKPLIHLKNNLSDANWKIGIYEDRRLAGFINDMFYYAQDSTHIGFEYEGVLVANIDENGNFSTTSDKRLKKNIKSLPPVIEKIMKLTPSNYEMKNSPNKTHIGFIAQNINDNFPELINHYYNGEYDQHFVNYDGMIPVLTKAIQEQQNTIDLLVDKIEKLEKLIDQEP